MISNFMSMIEKRSENECWPWKGHVNPKGYGKFDIPIFNGSRKQVYSHRLMWEICFGDHDMCVLHKCDNPTCVNPNHLFLGSKADNNIDKKNKNRASRLRGSDNGRSKLTDSQVKDILIRLANGEKQEAIASLYKVSQVLISKIKLKRNWTHI